MLTLLLTQSGVSVRKILQIDSGSTLAELYRSASTMLDLKESSFTLSVGFPPKTIICDATKTIADAGIRNQDRIQATKVTTRGTAGESLVARVADTKADSASVASITSINVNQKKPAIKTDEPEQRRTKRKAAQRAEESFAETIQAQDTILARETPSKRSGKSYTRTGTQASSATTRFPTASVGEGRRLVDGTVVSPAKRSRKVTKTNESDPSLALLNTLDERSTAGRLMRKGWRHAVTNAYEQNQAVARLAAIPRSVQIQHSDNSNLLKVQYPKGLQGRGTYDEEVDFIPLDVLQSCLEGIYSSNTEALRPENLAILSPRVLWSLVYHHPQLEITEIYRALLPDLDWSFLRRRPQQLSEKARENLRQKQTASHSISDNNIEAAAAAIASVEAAMETLFEYNRSQKRQLNLKAIESRQRFILITPNDVDEDELRECIGETTGAENLDMVIQNLIDRDIRNWRELANCDPEEASLWLGVSLEAMTSWIERAQLESVEEIILEVCEGNSDAVYLLRERASSGTPKDLTNWMGICDMLRETLLLSDYGSPGNTASLPTQKVPSVEQLERWCDRARQAIDQLAWLEQVTTPV